MKRWLSLILMAVLFSSAVGTAEDAYELDIVPNELALEDEAFNPEAEAMPAVSEDALLLNDIALETPSASEESVAPAGEPQDVEQTIPTKLTLGVKETFTLRYENASFKSSSKSVATVDKNGVITAKSAGKAKIKVKSRGKTVATCKVTVLAAPKKVTLNQTKLTLPMGSTATLTATLPKKTASNKLTWKSSNKKIVKVDKNGVLTPVKAGKAKITVTTFNNKKATCTVTVNHDPVSVKFESKSISIGLGEAVTVKPVLNKDAKTTFTWSTKNKKIATVNKSGKITGKKIGSTKITVKTKNGLSATLTVKVLKKPGKVTLAEEATVEVGSTIQLKAKLPSKTASHKLTWKSSSKKIAKVDANGVVTGVKAGTATITVTTFNKQQATCTVTVTAKPEPTEAPSEEPTEAPTEAPIELPTEAPTEAPSEEPTEAPTEAPTVTPTEAPTANVAIDETSFPDANFRTWVLDNCDTDGDGALSDEEIAAVTGVDVACMDISSLKGIGFFTALKKLECDHTNLTELDLGSNTALVELRCHDSRLTSLDLSKNVNLEQLYCGNVEPERSSHLEALDLSHNRKLTYLHCGDAQLTSLNLNGCTALEGIKCYGNQLTALDVSECKALRSLQCYNNKLTKLDVSHNTALEYLSCFENRLTSLDVSNCPALASCLVNGEKETLDFCVSYAENENGLEVDESVQLTPAPAAGGEAEQDVGVAVDETNFPDANFRAWVLENCDADGNSVLSDAEIAAVNDIDVQDMEIGALTGIEFFAELKSLNCRNNLTLTEFDLSHNIKLEELDCGSTGIESLNVSRNTALQRLACDHLLLTTLDVRKNTALKRLECCQCQLTGLDLSQNTQLEGLWCMNNEGMIGNRIAELDVSKNTRLKELWCYEIGLTSLNVNHVEELEELFCYGNELTTLDVGDNTSLRNLRCYDNQLTTLDVSNNRSLKSLNCAWNALSEIEVSNNEALKVLCCNGNSIAELDIRKCPKLIACLTDGTRTEEDDYISYHHNIDDHVDIDETTHVIID